MVLKTKKNIRNTRYGPGYTSSEVALMSMSNLAGLEKDDLDLLTEDSDLKMVNESTFNLNRRKMNNLLAALSEGHITVGEFQVELQTELDRTNAKFDSINISG